MIRLLYAALKDKLPLHICHDIVHDSSSFYMNPEEATTFVTELLREYDDKTMRLFKNNHPGYFTYDRFARGVCKSTEVDSIIENRIKTFPMECLMSQEKWEFEMYIKDLGRGRDIDMVDLTVPTCWDIGCQGDAMGELLSTWNSIQIEDGMRWRTILQAVVTDGTVTRNWKEGGNMYLEPTEWFIQIA